MTNSDAFERMRQTAVRYRDRAHAPYSKFAVGAAVLCEDGKIYGGCNVENSSFGLTVCAERVAIFNAVADGRLQFQALAVVTDGGHYPCGACRQVMAEFASDLSVFVGDANEPDKPFVECSLSSLLPGSFSFPTSE